jgi:hypothetical protein
MATLPPAVFPGTYPARTDDGRTTAESRATAASESPRPWPSGRSCHGESWRSRPRSGRTGRLGGHIILFP